MKKIKDLYTVNQLPVFQNVVFSTSEEAINCIKGNVILVQDMQTGLVYNREYDPSLQQYGVDYQNEQSYSAFFSIHLDEVIAIIHKYFQGLKIIEIGCGKGHFLECLQRSGYSIIGCDPAYEGDNPDIHNESVENYDSFSFEGIILRHVLEHIQDPFKFLCTLQKKTFKNCKIYIEVPSFEWICKNRTWFDIYYEHVNYFSLVDFRRMFQVIFEDGYLFKGQYIYVVADLSSLQKPKILSNEIISFPHNFLAGISKYKLNKPRMKSVIWGGSSKGVIFALLMKREGRYFDFVIDINPKKQQKFLPATGLPIYSPEEGLSLLKSEDEIFIMNSNYLEEIITLSERKFTYITVDNDTSQ